MTPLRALTATALLALLEASGAPIQPPSRSAPLLGLEAALPSSATVEERERATRLVRESGVDLFSVTVSWSDAEPISGKYRLEEILRSVRILRQSGATVHLDLPIVSVNARDLPGDLETVRFDDPRLSLRLGRLLDALEPALLDASTLSLGYAADAYFAGHPDDLTGYRLLVAGAVDFLRKKAPGLLVGVTTATPTESAAPAVVDALHQGSAAVFYLYAPFERTKPFTHRPPEALDRDWTGLLESAHGRPIAFPEVSYSSAAENGSSPEKQAEFVRRFRRFLGAADRRTLLFARYVSWRDESAAPTPAEHVPAPARKDATGAAIADRQAAFLAHRGLQTERGEPKPAWRQWVRRSP